MDPGEENNESGIVAASLSGAEWLAIAGVAMCPLLMIGALILIFG